MKRSHFKKFLYFGIILFLFFPLINYSSILNQKSKHINTIKQLSDIPEVDISQLPQIDYESINNSWYDSKIEMLIITPDGNDGFANSVKPLMDWKNSKGVKTIIANDYYVNSSKYGGTGDNASLIRDMIKYYHRRENIQWVLLAGDAEDGLIPIREVLNNDTLIVGETEAFPDNTYKPTDFYYADLTGNWDSDGDGEYGESAENNDDGIDEISWIPEVYVGRLPADDTTELNNMVNKIIKYETNPTIGDWMNKMLLGGGISSFKSPDKKTTDEDEAKLTEYIWKHYTKSEMEFMHLYETTGAFTPETPPLPNQEAILTNTNFITNFNSNYSTVFFAGHGTPTVFESKSPGVVYDNSDASSALNINKPSLVYGDACSTSSYDENDNNIGETLIKHPDGGAIGYIGGLRVTWYFQDDPDLEYLNRGNAKLFWKEFFQKKKFQQGKALYDSKVAYLNSDIFKYSSYSITYEWERKNVLTYCLLGDPEVDIYTNKPGNLTNYFTENIYEGQIISMPIIDNYSRVVPYARVHLKSADGKYLTAYANEEGIVNVFLPNQVNETYNVTITGHNLLPSFFNFTTLLDNEKPEIIDDDITPIVHSVSDNVNITIKVNDDESGVEGVFVFFTNDNFQNYEIYKLSNETFEDKNTFVCTLNKLNPGEYSYLVVVRDRANNTDIFYQNSYKIIIPRPLMDYVLFITLILIIAIAGIAVFIIPSNIKKFEQTLKRIEEEI